MERQFSTFIGIDLGGARGKTTAVARLTCMPADAPEATTAPDVPGGSESPRVVVQEVNTRHQGIDAWHDAVLLDYVASLPRTAVIAINAPLTVPACLRCQLPVCPGKQACQDPAVQWLYSEGEALVGEALEGDMSRIAAIPAGRAHQGGGGQTVPRTPRPKPRIEPYIHRAAEIVMHYGRGLLPRDALGLGVGPIAARGVHLRRLLAGSGFQLDHNLIEVSPRATVCALFDAQKARGYKRDADPWETRAAILEGLPDLCFAPSSRMSREEVLRNDHCFEALLSGYTAYLWARDGWSLPAGIFAIDGWIWAPP